VKCGPRQAGKRDWESEDDRSRDLQSASNTVALQFSRIHPSLGNILETAAERPWFF